MNVKGQRNKVEKACKWRNNSNMAWRWIVVSNSSTSHAIMTLLMDAGMVL